VHWAKTASAFMVNFAGRCNSCRQLANSGSHWLKIYTESKLLHCEYSYVKAYNHCIQFLLKN